ncbi:MAG: peptide chain release factor N(5)-glutamine methyltransferase [Zoogloeaceae bacterium]|nr:peptide chain release factor N(5)-glutamine methyltransferase [Zoogloeaceae bacterium]
MDALDARLLAQHVLQLSHAELICDPDKTLDAPCVARLAELVERRAQGEPLAYLVGEARFRARTFKVTPAVLVPRPETEELVGLALALLAESPAPDLMVLDLGCGSGAIAISIALECPRAKVTGVDTSAEALQVAETNATALAAEARFLQSDWFSALADENFHLIVANPPYIAADDPYLAGDGLRYEPRLALTDEADGLSCLRAIIHAAPRHLKPGGHLLCEHGHAQGEAVRHLLADAGFSAIKSWRDLSGNERFSGGVIPVRLEERKL